MSGQRLVRVGDRWRSRDPRDEGLVVTVLKTEGPGGFVYIQRFRKSRVRWENFQRQYDPVGDSR